MPPHHVMRPRAGGPGFEAPHPTDASGWIKSATASFRVVLMDQRGVGRSSQISTRNLGKGRTPEQQAEYLSFFRWAHEARGVGGWPRRMGSRAHTHTRCTHARRADSIVRDAELMRAQLVPNGGRWSILGQSFGGFCSLTYMSLAPEGGRAPVGANGARCMLPAAV